MKAKGERMWQAEDLPLFSETAPRSPFPGETAALVPQQKSWAKCKVCLDTGWVETKHWPREYKPCWCGGAGNTGKHPVECQLCGDDGLLEVEGHAYAGNAFCSCKVGQAKRAEAIENHEPEPNVKMVPVLGVLRE